VPEVVRTGGERGGESGRQERQRASFLPHPEVRRRADHSPAFVGEEPSVVGHAEGIDVVPQDRDEVRRDRHGPDLFHGPVLESPVVVRLAGVGPPLTAGTSVVQQCRSPSLFRKLEACLLTALAGVAVLLLR
jgi:hypothetical protein